MKFVVWVAAGMLLLSPALAANSTKSSLVAQILAKRLESEAAGRVRPFATVNRSGTLKMVGVVQNLSGLSGPITATALFETLSGSGNLFLEQGSTTVHFKGKIGKFTIKLPYHWHGADPTAYIVYGVTLTAGSCPDSLLAAAGGGDTCRRISEYLSYNPLPVPTQDGITTAATVSMVQ